MKKQALLFLFLSFSFLGNLGAFTIVDLPPNKVVGVSNGGTGGTSTTGVIIGNGTSPYTARTGVALQVLRRNAGNTDFEFADPAGGGIGYPGAGIPVSTGAAWDTSLTGTALQVLRRNAGNTAYEFAAPSGGMVYPALGITISTGSAWDTSITGTALQILRRNAGNTAYEFATLAFAASGNNSDITQLNSCANIYGNVEFHAFVTCDDRLYCNALYGGAVDMGFHQWSGAATVVPFGSVAAGALDNTLVLKTGFVGIGTPSPNLAGYGSNTTVESIEGPNSASSEGVLELIAHASNVTSGQAVGIIDFLADYNTSNKEIALISCLLSGASAHNYGGLLKFYTKADGGSLTENGSISNAGIWRMNTYGAGAATFDASGNISSVSDERLKNIQGDFKASLKEILTLNPILFKWKPESGLETEHTYAGFSAQNVMKSIPQAVGQNKEGFYSLDDRTIIAALVNSTKELHNEIFYCRVAVGCLFVMVIGLIISRKFNRC